MEKDRISILEKENSQLKQSLQKLTKERDDMVDKLNKSLKNSNIESPEKKKNETKTSDELLEMPEKSLETLGPFGIKPNANVKIQVHEEIDLNSKKVYAQIINMPTELSNYGVISYVEFSEISKITLSPKLKKKAGISEEAEYFAWSYPAPGVGELCDLANLNLAEDVVGFMVFGGYVYFDKAFKLCQVNCIVIGENLFFNGPYKFNAEYACTLHRDGLFLPISIKDLLEQGALNFCWIPPNKKLPNSNVEDIKVKYWSGHPAWNHGAFVYEMIDKTYRYFNVIGVEENEESMEEGEEGEEEIVLKNDFVPWTALTQTAKINKINISRVKENTEAENGAICCICFEEEVKILFMPCRHLCCCQKCANHKKLIECPKCRNEIKQKIMVFI